MWDFANLVPTMDVVKPVKGGEVVAVSMVLGWMYVTGKMASVCGFARALWMSLDGLDHDWW